MNLLKLSILYYKINESNQVTGAFLLFIVAAFMVTGCAQKVEQAQPSRWIKPGTLPDKWPLDRKICLDRADRLTASDPGAVSAAPKSTNSTRATLDRIQSQNLVKQQFEICMRQLGYIRR